MRFATFGDQIPLATDRREIRAFRAGERHKDAADDATMQGQPCAFFEMVANYSTRVLAKEADSLGAFPDVVRDALPGCVANALQQRSDLVLDAEIAAVGLGKLPDLGAEPVCGARLALEEAGLLEARAMPEDGGLVHAGARGHFAERDLGRVIEKFVEQQKRLCHGLGRLLHLAYSGAVEGRRLDCDIRNDGAIVGARRKEKEMREEGQAAIAAEPAVPRDGKIDRVTLRILRLPLYQPYRLSYRTFTEFMPIVAEVKLADGRLGWGEGHISPGSSTETREGGWHFALAKAEAMLSRSWREASLTVQGESAASPVAAGALAVAAEMAGEESLLRPASPIVLPLLTPINSLAPREIGREIETCLEQGYRAFKVKVGKSVGDDLARVRAIQAAVAGRASLRLDANRGFGRADALAFVAGLDPESIELFEQPCASDAWDDNAAVAAASPVPLMLDEPICSLADISRAGGIPGVGFCKVKLKRFGGLRRLRAALEAIRAHGMRAVLGDGLGTDLSCWMEACVGAGLIHGAGEFNGFLKIREPLLAPPLAFGEGRLHVAPDYAPCIDWRTHRAAVTAEHIVQ